MCPVSQKNEHKGKTVAHSSAITADKDDNESAAHNEERAKQSSVLTCHGDYVTKYTITIIGSGHQ